MQAVSEPIYSRTREQFVSSMENIFSFIDMAGTAAGSGVFLRLFCNFKIFWRNSRQVNVEGRSLALVGLNSYIAAVFLDD